MAAVVLGFVAVAATLLWEFQVPSLAVSTTPWVSIGLASAALTEWSTRRRPPVAEQTATPG